VIPVNKQVTLYKTLAHKAKQLRVLAFKGIDSIRHKICVANFVGMNYEATGRSLKIGQETVRRACNYEDQALLMVSL
jgi:hypothetical protein